MKMRDVARMWAAGAFHGGGSLDSGYLPVPGGRWRTAKPLGDTRSLLDILSMCGRVQHRPTAVHTAVHLIRILPRNTGS